MRAWRLERSKELKQPAFCVFTDATLTRIAEVRPQTTQELATIGGVGPAKLTAYAAEVLELCSASNSADLSSPADADLSSPADADLSSPADWIRLP